MAEDYKGTIEELAKEAGIDLDKVLEPLTDSENTKAIRGIQNLLVANNQKFLGEIFTTVDENKEALSKLSDGIGAIAQVDPKMLQSACLSANVHFAIENLIGCAQKLMKIVEHNTSWEMKMEMINIMVRYSTEMIDKKKD